MFEISDQRYSLAELCRVADEEPELSLSPEVRRRIGECADFIERISTEDRHIYGVNTGFGPLCETRVEPSQMSELQRRHLLSHACGVGPTVPERLSRLVMLVKLLTFRAGRSGITPESVDRLLELWNNDLIPAIPKKGTVGASGDLAPLAHMALPLIGFGEVHSPGGIISGSEALAQLGREPIRLRPKEGLALTNGVQYINACAAELVEATRELIAAADVIAALSMQGFSCAETFYAPLLHTTSLHPERMRIAENLTRLLAGSNHYSLPGCNPAKEDPYSFRCVPQVHAAVRQGHGFVAGIIEQECNSVSDNPLFFAETNEVLLGGSLHGESTAIAMDQLAIAMCELANISERRTYQLLSGQHGLPDFLAPQPGLDSGLMIPQYTSAALVTENKVFATPSSIDTIPTSQLQEDHVSMGGSSVFKLQKVVANCRQILAIELLTAVQACDLAEGLVLSPETQTVHDQFRERVPFLEQDRFQAPDLEAAREFLTEHAPEWATRGS
jgi:histidine ammonia-lyase